MKKALKILGVLILIAVIAAAIYIHPYYKMPPEPRDELDRLIASYQAVAEEMENRPKEDRIAFDKLNKQMEKMFNEGPDRPVTENCPAVDFGYLEEHEEFLGKVLSYDDSFRALLDGGFVLQQEATLWAVIPNLRVIRNFAYWETAAAVQDAENGRSKEAVDRFELLLTLNEGFAETAFLIHQMIGVAIENIVFKGIIQCIHDLDDDSINRLQNILPSLSDKREHLISAMQAEAAMFISALDMNYCEPGKDCEDGIAGSTKSWETLVKVGNAVGYMTREKYMYVHIMNTEIENFRNALKNDAGQAPETAVKEKIKYSPMAMLALPNMASLFQKTFDAMDRRQAMLKAFKIELANRQIENAAGAKIPYDDRNVIMLYKDYGCIEKIEKEKSQ